MRYANRGGITDRCQRTCSRKRNISSSSNVQGVFAESLEAMSGNTLVVVGREHISSNVQGVFAESLEAQIVVSTRVLDLFGGTDCCQHTCT